MTTTSHVHQYLFTGDTMFPTEGGLWSTFLAPGRGDPDALSASLEILGSLIPDVVISSAFGGDTAVYELTAGRWPELIAQAQQSVRHD